MPFLSLVSLTFDLDLQTRPNEGPNASYVWILRKSVQWLARYFIHKQKKVSDRQRQKHNLPQFTACGNNAFYFCISAAGAVGSLIITQRGSNHLVVQWAAPSDPNGVITEYVVSCEVGELQLDCLTLERFESFLPDTEEGPDGSLSLLCLNCQKSQKVRFY